MKNGYCGLENALEVVESHGSAGEKQIARMLSHYGIRFFYEYPMAVVDRGKVRIYYPDFWLPDYGMAIEYFGIESSPEYSRSVEHKKQVYEATGVSCIYVDADAMKECWPKQILDQVRGLLADRLDHFDSSHLRSSGK